jgi:hypothetical protein
MNTARSVNAAQVVAEALTARFMLEGNFTAGVPLGNSVGQLYPTATSDVDVDALFDESGYAGLAVQAVGYEEETPEPKVHVYVSKGSRRAVDRLPTSDGEIKIKVNRIGKLIIRPEHTSSATNRGHIFLRRSRVACGSSCAPSGENYSGTFGAILHKTGNAKKIFILSNNHVLAACNHTPVSMPILSPSNSDARPGSKAPGEIARHSEICELRSGVPALVAPCQEDLAIAEVPDPNTVSSWQGDIEGGFDTPAHAIAPRTGMRVKKWGRTTGLTTGVIESHSTLTHVQYKYKYFSAMVYFRDVWFVRSEDTDPFVLPGDSGSLVVTEDETKAIGVVFAGGQGYGVIVPMPHVSTCFGGVRLTSGHGV